MVVAGHVEMLSGRRKKDYEAEAVPDEGSAVDAPDAADADAAEPIPDVAAA